MQQQRWVTRHHGLLVVLCVLCAVLLRLTLRQLLLLVLCCLELLQGAFQALLLYGMHLFTQTISVAQRSRSSRAEAGQSEQLCLCVVQLRPLFNDALST
jgi:hypothetical protein